MHDRHTSTASQRIRNATSDNGPSAGHRTTGHMHAPSRVARMLSSVLNSLVSVIVAITMVTVTILGLIVVLLMRGPGAGAGPLSNPNIIESSSVIFGPGPPAPTPAPRVALLFFGLTRSLKYTLPSIETNVVKPLREHGVPTDIFLHTYNDTDDASSAGTDASEWRMLHPSKYIITSQQTFIDATQCAPHRPPSLPPPRPRGWTAAWLRASHASHASGCALLVLHTLRAAPCSSGGCDCAACIAGAAHVLQHSVVCARRYSAPGPQTLATG